jgi:hypothetical protein
MQNVALRVEVKRKYKSIHPKKVKVEKLGVLRRMHRYFDLEGAKLSDCIIYYGALSICFLTGLVCLWALLFSGV